MSSTDPKPSPSPSIRPGLIRRTFRRHWIGMLAVWLLGSLAAATLVYQTVKPSYRAMSLIRIEPTVTDLYKGRNANDNFEPFLQTQVQLITSPNVLTAAATNRKASVLEPIRKAQDVVLELRKAVSVTVIPNTYLIEVSMTSPSGYEAATIVNAVVDAFVEANNEWSDGTTRLQIRNLEAYKFELDKQIDGLEQRWKALAAKGDFDVQAPDNAKKGPLPDRALVTIEEWKAVRAQAKEVALQVAEAQAWLATANVALARAENGAGPGDEQAAINDPVLKRFLRDPEVVAHKAEISKIEARISDLERVATPPDDPALTAARRKLTGLMTDYNVFWKVKSPTLRKEMAPDLEKDIRDATTAVNKLLARQALLKEELSRLDVKNKNQATDAVEIALIQGERTAVKELQDAVIRRLEQLKFEAKGEARIRVVNPNGAMTPGKPISDHRLMIAGIIPFAMLFVAFGLFAGVEAFSGPGFVAGKGEPLHEV